MRKIAIANRKGGVGKTTTAVNLAHGLAMTGERVLLVDTDTQAYCSRLLGVDPEHGLAELIEGNVPPSEAQIEAREGLFLLAGSRRLEKVLENVSERGFAVDLILTEALKPYEGQYDFVILDTAPGFSRFSVNVIFYADELLIPVSMEILALDGFNNFLDEIGTMTKYTDIEVRYIVPTFYDRRVSKSDEILEHLQEHFGGLVTAPIRYSTRLSEAPAWGKTVYEIARRERVSQDYKSLSEAIA